MGVHWLVHETPPESLLGSSSGSELDAYDRSPSSDDDEISRFLRTPRLAFHRQLLSPRSHYVPLSWRLPAAALFVVLLILPASMLFLLSPRVGDPPNPRKAAIMTAFNAVHTSLNNQSRSRSALLVWGGLGHGPHVAADAAAFDLGSRTWAPFPGRDEAAKDQMPVSRWKAAVSILENSPEGLLILGGESESGTLSDMWLLELSELRWTPAIVKGQWRPESRHSHVAVPFEDKDRRPGVAIYGGRSSGLLLGDVWVAELHQWPNVTWHRLEPESTSIQTTKQGATKEKKKPRQHPGLRAGHSGLIFEENNTGSFNGKLMPSPKMVIFGGRSQSGTHNDVWLLDILSGKWTEIMPMSGSPVPVVREHAAAIMYSGKLFVFGGQTWYPELNITRPLGDLWVFDFARRRWNQVLEYGAKPPPRFLASFLKYVPKEGTAAPKMYLFGGQTLERCKLNDVWQLTLDTVRWELLAPNHFARRRCDRVFGN